MKVRLVQPTGVRLARPMEVRLAQILQMVDLAGY